MRRPEDPVFRRGALSAAISPFFSPAESAKSCGKATQKSMKNHARKTCAKAAEKKGRNCGRKRGILCKTLWISCAKAADKWRISGGNTACSAGCAGRAKELKAEYLR
jgi:hypothetical protein